MAVFNMDGRDIKNEASSGPLPTVESKKDKKSGKSKKKKSDKPKKDISAIVHRGCRIVIYRVIEFAILFLVLSLLYVIVGSGVVPSLAYDMAVTFGITQSTDIYTAVASWGFSMLFYVIICAVVAFTVSKKFIVKLHTKFTNIIDKPEKTEESAK